MIHLNAFIIILHQEAWNFWSLFDSAVTCQETRSKTFAWNRMSRGNIALFLCRAFGRLSLFSRTRECRLTHSIQVFSVFHTLLLNVVSLLMRASCERERQRRERKKRLISLQIFTSLSSITALLTLCLLAPLSNWFRIYYGRVQLSWIQERWKHINYASAVVTWNRLFQSFSLAVQF